MSSYDIIVLYLIIGYLTTNEETSEMNEMKNQLAEQFLRLDRLLFRYLRRSRGKDSSFMNPRRGQGRVLSLLKLQPEIEQRELGYLLNMSRQALAELLGKLEKSGYITRTQSDKDRRSFIVTLTDKGREALPDRSSKTDDDDEVEAVFGCLNEDEQDSLGGYLDRIIASLEEQFKDGENDYAEFVRERFFSKHGFDEHGGGWFGHGHGHRHGRGRGHNHDHEDGHRRGHGREKPDRE